MSNYVPMGVRTGRIDPDVLHEGVPPWLRKSLIDWMNNALEEYAGRGGTRLSVRRLQAIERHARVGLNWGNPTNSYVARATLHAMAASEPHHEAFLWALDYLCSEHEGSSKLDGLETILREGGSAWRVSTVGTPHLERRVPLGVVEAAEATISEAGHAGELLALAWQALYGMKPDPSKAYGHAIKAVETAAHEAAEPNNTKATLGTMLGAMRANPTGWEVATEGEHPMDSIIAMMETLWTGQTDRHGAKGGVRPLIDGAAVVAVDLAVALVGFFAAGVVHRVDS